jgi:hypothetical protein
METAVTLVTLFSGLVPVALLFLGTSWLAGGRSLRRAPAWIAVMEAVLLSLIAGLWFASLGEGGWPVLFLLFGFLVGLVEWGRQPPGEAGRPARLVLTVLRYVAAGALLAWRLG